MKNKTFIFHADQGQTWLAVRYSNLVELEIEDQISEYSRQKNSTVYCDDHDAGIFIKAFTAKYKKAPKTKYGKFSEKPHRIRKYSYYSPDLSRNNVKFSVITEEDSKTDFVKVSNSMLLELNLLEIISSEVRAQDDFWLLPAKDAEIFKSTYKSKYGVQPNFIHEED